MLARFDVTVVLPGNRLNVAIVPVNVPSTCPVLVLTAKRVPGVEPVPFTSQLVPLNTLPNVTLAVAQWNDATENPVEVTCRSSTCTLPRPGYFGESRVAWATLAITASPGVI